MKSIFRILLFPAFLLLFHFAVNAQSSPPPPPGHGSTDNQTPGGDSPIGGGAGFLLLMAAGYGAKKVYDARKRLAE
jgi:uncharacterized membrane protein YphA (DoxX/SURF4 family)